MGFLGLGFSGLSEVGFWVRQSRSQFLGLSELESVSGFAISLLSLSLSARLSLEILLRKIAMKIILHQNKGIFRSKRKSFTVDRIFRVLPNTHFYRDRKSTRLNSSHERRSRMPSSA